MLRRGKKRDTTRLLREEAVGPQTRTRYALALERFNLFLAFYMISTLSLFVDPKFTDAHAADYVQWLYSHDCPMQWAADLLSAISDK